jgi:hypothetical protein
MSNVFDTAYVVGYYAGYHTQNYQNEYDKHSEAQMRVKYSNGYEAGIKQRQEERTAGQ